MRRFSQVLIKIKSSRELARELKSFNRIYADCEQLKTIMSSGVLELDVIDLLLSVKKGIETRGQYTRMDRLISDTHRDKESATITDIMGRLSYELIFLRYEDRDGDVVLIPSRCRDLLSMMEELRQEKALYDEGVEKLRRLKENLSIITL